jgi:hypothetical protein
MLHHISRVNHLYIIYLKKKHKHNTSYILKTVALFILMTKLSFKFDALTKRSSPTFFWTGFSDFNFYKKLFWVYI